MNDDSHKSELLSAYLDKEASAAEQAETEQFLESDPEARRVLEGISQIGELIRELPQERVGRAFTANVMSRVRQQPPHASPASSNRERQAEPADDSRLNHPAGQPVEEERHAKHVVLPAAAEQEPASRRRFGYHTAWLLAAVAAALLLMLYPGGLFTPSGDPENAPVVVDNEDPIDGGGELVIDPPHDDPEKIADNQLDEPVGPDRQSAPENLVVDNSIPSISDPDREPRDDRPPNVVPVVPMPDLPGLVDFTEEDRAILRLLESLVLVRIECSPTAAKAREFDKILKKYEIKLAEKASPRPLPNALVPQTEVYYIEASAFQAEAVLNEVDSRKSEFKLIATLIETAQTGNALNADGQNEPAPRVPPASESEESEPADRSGDPAAEGPSAADVPPSRGSFAEKIYVPTDADLAALREQGDEALSASAVLPFLQGESGFDAILGPSAVETEHLVRMLVVLNTVEPKQEP